MRNLLASFCSYMSVSLLLILVIRVGIALENSSSTLLLPTVVITILLSIWFMLAAIFIRLGGRKE